MKHFIFTFFWITFSHLVNGQTAKLELKPVQKDYYAWITFLSEGPVNWMDVPEGEVTGKAYRACITTSEIHNNLYIEEITYGPKGCCKQISSKKELDLFELLIKFELTGEVTNVHFSQWIDNSTFEIEIKDQLFSISIGESNAQIQRKN